MKNKLQIENNTATLSDPAKVAKLLKKGLKDALMKHKKAGNAICESKNGKVIWIPPRNILKSK